MTRRGSNFLRWFGKRSGTRRVRRLLVLASAMLLPAATRAQESTSAPPAARTQARAHAGLVSDLLDEIAQAASKIVALARALPDSASGWRPAAGVRSAHEVMVHVAAENFYAAAKWGGRVDPATMVTGATHSESDAYERRPHTRAQAIAALERSFALMREGLASLPDSALDAPTVYARKPVMTRTAWVRTATHLHEHLGQLIAYARSNGVAPPWSVPAPPSRMVVDSSSDTASLRIPLRRDGMPAATVARPAGAGPFPVAVTRARPSANHHHVRHGRR